MVRNLNISTLVGVGASEKGMSVSENCVPPTRDNISTTAVCGEEPRMLGDDGLITIVLKTKTPPKSGGYGNNYRVYTFTEADVRDFGFCQWKEIFSRVKTKATHNQDIAWSIARSMDYEKGRSFWRGTQFGIRTVEFDNPEDYF